MAIPQTSLPIKRMVDIADKVFDIFTEENIDVPEGWAVMAWVMASSLIVTQADTEMLNKHNKLVIDFAKAMEEINAILDRHEKKGK